MVGVIDRPANSMILYIDGISKGTATPDNTNNSNMNPELRVGSNWDNSTPFAGSVDEVRIYNRALTTDEISSLYNSGK